MFPVGLTIAGSDNSAGAGAQADLKTMSALGVYGVTAITCVVAEVTTPGEMRSAGLELAAAYGRAFLIKGGHLRLDPAVDLLCTPDGAVREFSAPFVQGISTHGTGCTYAAAITAGLAKGLPLPE